ncbi:MAG TPA: hypothetical protein VM223_27235 [Planctomycetota bacterium]|nr:hypothetical protein [Planctomycetota bacterium]
MKKEHILVKMVPILVLACAVAGCTQQVVQPPGRVTSVSFTPKGTGDSGTWVAADSRVLRFRSTRFLDRLGLAWRTSSAASGREPARFALLSPQRALELNQQGKGRFEYAPTEDAAAYLLTRAGSTILYSQPQFTIRNDEGSLDIIELSGEADPDAAALDVQVTASEIPAPARGANPLDRWKWTGSARIPIEAGRCALIEIPSDPQRRAGARSRLMVLLVPGSFAWRNRTIRDDLPWGKVRLTTIQGRELTVKWMPTWLTEMMNDE